MDSASGGRLSPPRSGFRPQIDVGGTHTSCVVESLVGSELLEFGKEHRVAIRLMFPSQYPNAFNVGDSVRLFEGSKLIGTGTVVEL